MGPSAYLSSKGSGQGFGPSWRPSHQDAGGPGHGQPRSRPPGEPPGRTDCSAGTLQSHCPPEEAKEVAKEWEGDLVRPSPLPSLPLHELPASMGSPGAQSPQASFPAPQKGQRHTNHQLCPPTFSSRCGNCFRKTNIAASTKELLRVS